MKEVLDFLYDLTLYLYKYLPFNLKEEMFQDVFDTHLLCINTQLYWLLSFKRKIYMKTFAEIVYQNNI